MSANNIKMKNDFVILARDASIDESDRMISIFKIIDRFSFSVDNPEAAAAIEKGDGVNVPFRCVACTSWSTENLLEKKLNLVLQYSIVNPDGEVVATGEQPTEMEAGTDTLRFNLNIEGFGFKGDGVYRYEFRLLDGTSNVLAKGSARLRAGREDLVA